MSYISMMDLLWAVADNVVVPDELGEQMAAIRERLNSEHLGNFPESEMNRSIRVHGVIVSLDATFRQSVAAGLLDKCFHDASVRGTLDCYEWTSVDYPKLLESRQFRTVLEPLAAIARDFNAYADGVNAQRATTVSEFRELDMALDCKRSDESFKRLRTVGFMRDSVARFLSSAGIDHGLSEGDSETNESKRLSADGLTQSPPEPTDQGRVPAGLKTREIRDVFGNLAREPWDYNKWDHIFQTKRMKDAARTYSGGVGAGGENSSRWNPVSVAILLIENYGISARSLNRRFNEHRTILAPWADIWTETLADLEEKQR